MRKAVISFLIIFFLASMARGMEHEDIREILSPHLDREMMYLKYNITEEQFFAVLDHAEDFIYKGQKPQEKEGLVCGTCLSTFKYLLTLKSEILLQGLQFIAYEVCAIAKIEDKAVCKGAVEAMTPIVISSLAQHYLNPTRVCPTIYLCPDFYKELKIQAYINETLRDKPVRPDPVPTGRQTIKMLHVSDMHIDFDYTPGSESNCGEPVCCEAVNGKAKSPATAAGQWGDLNGACDLPPETAIQAFNFIEEKLKPELAVWTGDTVDHTIWRQSREKNIYATLWATKQMSNIFNTTRMKIFPIDGNHEAYPVNNYDFFSDREDPLKEAFGSAWEAWIGRKAAEEVKKFMYYSTYVEQYNLKIIALETNACQDINFFLLKDPTDPGGMLAWLKGELLDAESKGQFVYVIGHIPTDGCMDQWARRYEALADRFNYTIRGQFFGHSHRDLFRVLYSQDRKTPVGTQFVVGALTTFTHLNPSFRIFEIDVDTGIPVTYRQYTLNLTKYNQLGTNVDKLEWDEAYEARSEYGLNDISPASMHLLRKKIKEDPKIAQKVMDHYNTGPSSGNATSFYCTTLGIKTEQNACSSGTTVEAQALGIVERLGGPWIERIRNSTIA